MPPWQADPTCGPFANTRLLTTNEINLFQRWFESGKLEGDLGKLPPYREFTSDWQLGPPDLIVTPPAPYRLTPQLEDTYYNLVIRIPMERPRFVRAVQFSPGKSGSVHHAFLRFDASGRCRRLIREPNGIGFPGLHVPSGVFSPESQFLSWQPGRSASHTPPGMNWKLQPGTELVLQLHLPPVREPTEIQPSVAFYFSDEPPARQAYKVRLTSFTFSIPAGATNHPVREEIVIPVPTTLISLLPHAHRLARSLVVTVTPPIGASKRVLEIPRWNFNWQTDYNFSPELSLPAGTKLAMEFLFDNPGSVAVGYGQNTSDEMAELWALLALNSPSDYNALVEAELPLVIRDTIAYNNYRLRTNPDDWQARLKIAHAFLNLNDYKTALAQLQSAIATAPNEAELRYWIGYVLFRLGRFSEAETELIQTIRFKARHGPAHGILGLINLSQRRFDNAAKWFRLALEIDPNDSEAREGLAKANTALKK